MPPKEDEATTKAAKLQKTKRRLSGFRTAFNTKMKGGFDLAKQAIGPPPLRSTVMVNQLNQRMAEIAVPYGNIKETIESILALIENDDDETAFNHYTEYLATVTTEYDQVRDYITVALDSIVEKPIKNEISIVDEEEEDDTPVVADGSSTAKRVVVKAVTELKPFKLNSEHEPAQFLSWSRSLKAYFDASNFCHLAVSTQLEYLRKVVDSTLMMVIDPSIGEDTPVFNVPDQPELGSIMDLLTTEMLSRHSIVSHCFSKLR